MIQHFKNAKFYKEMYGEAQGARVLIDIFAFLFTFIYLGLWEASCGVFKSCATG